MMNTFSLARRGLAGLLLAAASGAALAQTGADPLPSWRNGPRKRAILDFLAATTTEGGPEFVPPAERLAVFDNDGTLWVEQPLYTEFVFALERVRELAPSHPDWATREPFRSLLANDRAALLRQGQRGFAELIAASHTGVTPDEFHAAVSAWLAQARHPRFQRPYTELVYQPMLEVLSLFRARGFVTAIVSGGTIEFLRPWTPRVYGVPTELVIGTNFKMRWADGRLMILPEIDLVDDGPGKPVGIGRFLGRHPQAAFGNSDGDYEMLAYVTGRPGRRLGMIVHHDDAEREFAYDRDAHVGKLERGLNDAASRGWQLISMKADWSTVFRG